MTIIQGIILGVIATIILILGLGCYIEHEQIVDFRAQILTISTQKQACETVNQTWSTTAEQQNDQIKQLTDQANALQEIANQAETIAEKYRTTSNTQASSILTEKVDSDDCKGAAQVLSNYLRSRK
jgi:cell division protein FtsB